MSTLRDRFAAFMRPNERAATQAIAFHPPANRHFGTGISNQPSHETLLKESLGVSDYATRAIANRLMGLNPQVKVASGDGAGTLVDEVLDDHRLKGLLDRPHPNLSRSQLLRLTGQHIVTVGEAYWLKVGSRLGVPTELHPMPPGNVRPLLDQGVVSGYAVKTGKMEDRTLPADVIIRFYWPDPENPWNSEGYLGPNGVTADAQKFSGQHLRSHYQNDATPKSALEANADATPFQDAERQRFYGRWKQHFHARNGDEQGVPAILPTGYKLIQMAFDSGADITPLLEYWRDDQLMNFGVPRSALGQVVSGDRSSAETNDWVMDKHAVKPIADMIQETLTLQLAGDFDESIWVEFEPFVAEDKDFDLKQEDSDLRLKVRSVNQVREDRALDPVDWGEDPVGTLAETPYTGEGFDFNTPTPPDNAPPPVPGSDLEPDPEEPPRGAPGRRRSRSKRSRKQRSRRRAPRVRVITEDHIEAILAAISHETLTDPMLAEMRGLIREIGQAGLIAVGSPEAFLIESPQLIHYLERVAGEKIKGITDLTTKGAIREVLVEGNLAGEGADQLARRVRGVFAKATGPRARTIARTETVAAQTAADLAVTEQAGIAGNQWLSSRDDAVRESHNFQPGGMDGQVRRRGENFVSPRTFASGPGPGHMGLAEEDINCRCTLIPAPDAAAIGDSEEQRAQMWRAKEARRLPFERRMVRVVRAAMRAQERDALEALRENTDSAVAA